MFATRILPQKSYHSFQYHYNTNAKLMTISQQYKYIRALAELSAVNITALRVVWLTPVPWRTTTTHEPQLTLQHPLYTEPLSVLTGAADRHRHLTALSLSTVDSEAA